MRHGNRVLHFCKVIVSMLILIIFGPGVARWMKSGHCVCENWCTTEAAREDILELADSSTIAVILPAHIVYVIKSGLGIEYCSIRRKWAK